MVEEGYIEQDDMNKALAHPLEFNHGNFRFTMSTTLERLEERLDSDFFRELFDGEGIDDWRKAQLEIVTTLDARSQDAAKRALQTNISNLQMQLGGFMLPKAQFANKAQSARKGDYLYGAVDSVYFNDNGKLKSLTLSFGQLKGVVTEAAVKEFASQVGGDVNKILASQLKPGAILLVSVLDSNLIDGYAPCKIETEPVLQGALVAIQNGKVVASQGGFHNTGYDRSFKAVRQLGSSWKPLLYALALQHHWNYMDELENEFNVFQYVNQFYFPRPDHKNKGDVVTIAWSATRSENIASIWLLEHLLDKLDSNEFAEVAAQNGYAQEADEDHRAYFERLRDKFGLVMKEDVKREIEFARARDALAERYRLEGKPAKARAVLNLRYGTFTDDGIKQAKKDETLIKYLKHNYKNYAEVLRAREAKSLDPDVEATLPPMETVELFPNFSLADFKRLTTMMEPVDSEKDYLDAEQLRYWPDFRRSLSMAEYARFATEIGIHQKLQKVFSMPLGVNEITLGEISTAYQTLLTGKVFKCLDGEWTDPCFIKEIKNRDGRVIFRNEMESKQVLSDTVTSQMAVMLRSVFTNGTARSQVNNLSVSSEDRSTTLRFPVMGKTGTTNDYRNVAFMGALPTYVDEKNGIALDSVVAIGSYVGFDDNKPLKSGRTRIAGASGGLPQWASFAKEEIVIQGIPEHIDFFDISMLATGEVPLVLPNERGELSVDPMTGLVVSSSDGSGGRPLPWLEVPGFREAVAQASTEGATDQPQAGPTPELSIVPVEENAAPAQTEAVAEAVAESATETATLATEQPAAEQSAPAPAATAAPESKPAAAMPKDDDWDLPADLDGNNAFVPLEAGE
jgi:membrane peptidoglycan carboxypeptidase